jgi:tetratricopeptide (TPR) repeat protein
LRRIKLTLKGPGILENLRSNYIFTLLLAGLTGFIALSLSWAFIASSIYTNLGFVNLSRILLLKEKAMPAKVALIGPQFQFALRFNPDDGRALAGLGILANVRKDYEEATERLSAAYQRMPGHVPVGFFLGNAWEASGNHLKSLEIWRKVGAEEKFTLEGDILVEKKELQTARERYYLALEVSPDWRPAKEGLGKVLHQMMWQHRADGEHDQAIALLKEVVEISPSARDFILLGDYERDKNNYSLAKYWYERGLEYFHDDPIINNRIAWLSLQNGDLDDAEKRLHNSISFDPNYAYSYQLLGSVLFQQGRLQEAEEAVLESLRLEPTAAWSYVILGDIYAELGKIGAAINAYHQALTLTPDNNLVRDRLSTLAGGGP